MTFNIKYFLMLDIIFKVTSSIQLQNIYFNNTAVKCVFKETFYPFQKIHQNELMSNLLLYFHYYYYCTK